MPLPQENINSQHSLPEMENFLTDSSQKAIINDQSSVPKSSNLLTAQDVIDEIFVKFDINKEANVQKSSLENKTEALWKNKVARKKAAKAVWNLNKVSKAKQRSLLSSSKKTKAQHKNTLINTIKLSSENFNANTKTSDNVTNELSNNFSL